MKNLETFRGLIKSSTNRRFTVFLNLYIRRRSSTEKLKKLQFIFNAQKETIFCNFYMRTGGYDIFNDLTFTPWMDSKFFDRNIIISILNTISILITFGCKKILFWRMPQQNHQRFGSYSIGFDEQKPSTIYIFGAFKAMFCRELKAHLRLFYFKYYERILIWGIFWKTVLSHRYLQWSNIL